MPDNPEGWLFIVARNKALNLIKTQRSNVQFGDEETNILLSSGYTVDSTFSKLAQDELIKDDQLRMMFACCHPGISEEQQITLILKTLCGFSTAEIARAFLAPEDTISKRLYRARAFFRKEHIKLVIPSVDEITKRTSAVLNTIYLLFNEGYNSTHSAELVRLDVMQEAIVLCKLITENELTRCADAYALMALMLFLAARSKSRLSAEGELILLANQDRASWNYALIEKGNEYMNLASTGDTFSTYHLQAAIAYEHCVAESFETTNWAVILRYYEWLYRLNPSPVTALNRVVVVLQLSGPIAALKEVDAMPEKEKLSGFYLYHSLLGEIYGKLNQTEKAITHFKRAMELTQAGTERRLLQQKIIEVAL